MRTYTVHEPPPRRGDGESDPMRFVFVRDGFSFWAFLLGPLWFLRYRLWLALLGYVVAAAALTAAVHYSGASDGAHAVVGLLLAILTGLEANSLRRWTLQRRGWVNHGVVVADDLEAAERRFFDSWVRAQAHPPSSGPPATARMPDNAPEVIGLFPQPGGHS